MMPIFKGQDIDIQIGPVRSARHYFFRLCIRK